MKKVLLLPLLALTVLFCQATLAAEIIEENEPYTVVKEAPPKEIEEVITPSPGPEYVWIKGGWRWHDRWVWNSGRWVGRPHPHATWVSERWESRPHGWVHVRGHWH
jgi:hypothetical protein